MGCEHYKKIIDKIILNISFSKVKLLSIDTTLKDDLGFDSLDIVELIIELENEFYVSILDIDNIKNVGECYDLINKLTTQNLLSGIVIVPIKPKHRIEPIKPETAISKQICDECNLPRTKEGHDGCLGKLPALMNACCGHGGRGEGVYVQFLDGTCVRGEDAKTIINILKKHI